MGDGPRGFSGLFCVSFTPHVSYFTGFSYLSQVHCKGDGLAGAGCVPGSPHERRMVSCFLGFTVEVPMKSRFELSVHNS